MCPQLDHDDPAVVVEESIPDGDGRAVDDDDAAAVGPINATLGRMRVDPHRNATAPNRPDSSIARSSNCSSSAGGPPPPPPPADCGICLERVAADAMTACGGPACDHAFCTPCLGAHVASRVADRAYPIPCAAVGCAAPLPFAVAADLLAATPAAAAALARLHIEGSLMAAVAYCANAACGTPFEFEAGAAADDDGGDGCGRDGDGSDGGHDDGPPNAHAAAYEVTCPLCHHATCVRCRAAAHGGETCAAARSAADAADGLRSLAAARGWRACPRCGALIEKEAGGCNFMAHASCGAAFCFACGAPYADVRATRDNEHGRPACRCGLWDDADASGGEGEEGETDDSSDSSDGSGDSGDSGDSSDSDESGDSDGEGSSGLVSSADAAHLDPAGDASSTESAAASTTDAGAASTTESDGGGRQRPACPRVTDGSDGAMSAGLTSSTDGSDSDTADDTSTAATGAASTTESDGGGRQQPARPGGSDGSDGGSSAGLTSSTDGADFDTTDAASTTESDGDGRQRPPRPRGSGGRGRRRVAVGRLPLACGGAARGVHGGAAAGAASTVGGSETGSSVATSDEASTAATSSDLDAEYVPPSGSSDTSADAPRRPVARRRRRAVAVVAASARRAGGHP